MKNNKWKKALSLICILIVFFCTIPLNAESHTTKDSICQVNTSIGWLDTSRNISILHLEGSSYEMGYQHGVLLKEELNENFRAFVSFVKEYSNTSYDELLATWYLIKDYIPLQYLEEMQGLADGANCSLEMVGIGNIIMEWIHCSSAVFWDTATVDGSLYQIRSLDYPPGIMDPLSGKNLNENAVIIIRNPDYGLASFDPSFAGLVGSVGGFNEAGISHAAIISYSSEHSYLGAPFGFRHRLALDFAHTGQEAVDYLNSDATMGMIFLIGDGNSTEGWVVEQTCNDSYIGRWNDTTESQRPFWQIDCCLRRTNMFLDSNLSSTQRDWYDMSGLLGFLRTFLDSRYPITFYVTWLHYRAVSKGIENNLGTIDLEVGFQMLRDVYLGKSDPGFWIYQHLLGYTTSHQWCAHPSSGDIMISFATKDVFGYKTHPYTFNFYLLLNEPPPS